MAFKKVLSTEIRDHSKKAKILRTMPPKASLAFGWNSKLITHYWRRRRPGLSLVELQVAIAISAGIALLVGGVYFAYTKLFNEEKVRVHVASQNRIAIDEITNQIRESPGISTNCTICGTQTTSSSTVLILKLWPIDANGEVFEPTSGQFDYIVYRLDNPTNGTKLLKEIFPNGIDTSRIASSKILSTDVKTIQFTYDNADLSLASEVTLDLTNEAKSFTRTHSISHTSNAVLRNK